MKSADVLTALDPTVVTIATKKRESGVIAHSEALDGLQIDSSKTGGIRPTFLALGMGPIGDFGSARGASVCSATPSLPTFWSNPCTADLLYCGNRRRERHPAFMEQLP